MSKVFIKFITSFFIMVSSSLFILPLPDVVAYADSGWSKYIVDNRIDIDFYAQDNPLVRGLEYELLKGKSIEERNKLLYQWQDELEIARKKANEFNQNVRYEAGVLEDKSYYFYIRVFSVIYIIMFGLIAYFIKFYKWYDIFYLSFPGFYIIVFGVESVMGIGWFIALFMVYFSAIYYKNKIRVK